MDAYMTKVQQITEYQQAAKAAIEHKKVARICEHGKKFDLYSV